MKQTIFAAMWVDKMFGPMHLKYPDAESAIESARSIRKRGEGKVELVRAIQLDPSDSITVLDGPEMPAA